MITRFAPSPTGPLHLGHAYSAIVAHDMARAAGGTFLLRIEDIDRSRARAEWEAQIYEDLAWLGLHWETPVMRQSERMPAYQDALDTLSAAGLTFPCTCTRRDIAEALNAPQEGAMGPDGPIYPGTCKTVERHEISDAAIRLNITAEAIAKTDEISFTELLSKETVPTIMSTDLAGCIGDIVLARRDMGTSYHLSVVIDDAAQGVTHVVRGEDLFDSTIIHVVLQRLLGLPTPLYAHHRLIRDAAGKRLAKRDDARAISKYRAEGATPDDIRRMVGL